MSSTTLQFAAAPASSTPCPTFCGEHPEESLVGVCSTCLANKLSSLIYTSAALRPQFLDDLHVFSSTLSVSPQVSINSPTSHHHLQTIKEEADHSATEEIHTEGLFCSSVFEAPCRAVNEISAQGELAQRPSLHSNIIKELQISLSCDAIEENKSRINQTISLIKEQVRISNLEEGTPAVNSYLCATKAINCKSQSLGGLRGGSLIKTDDYASVAGTKGNQSYTGARKVALRVPFQLDDEENRAVMGSNRSESELGLSQFLADHNHAEETFERSSSGAAKQIEEAKDVHDNHTSNSNRCVPSASTLSSSVCPSIPCKFKHSVLLNSLFCRKTGDRERNGSGSIRLRPSRVHEATRTILITSVNEGGFPQVRDEGDFVRANYIASESMETFRRCESKVERSVSRSSVSSSSDQPASPPRTSQCFDMKSERKFNITVRALAAEFSSTVCSSAETTEARVPSPTKINDSRTQIEDVKGVQDLGLHVHKDSVAVNSDNPAKVSNSQREHHQVYSIPNATAEAESGEATENGGFSGTRKGAHDEEVGQAPTPLPNKHIILGTPTGDVPLNIQPWTLGSTVRMRANREMVYEEGARSDAGLDEEGIPTYMKATESLPSNQEVTTGVCWESLSCSGTANIAAGRQQGTHKAPETCINNGGVWEAYGNKSGKGAHKWASSSGTLKSAPDQSGLLRFYLAPLRSSNMPTRFLSARRPPTSKRQLWSLVFV